MAGRSDASDAGDSGGDLSLGDLTDSAADAGGSDADLTPKVADIWPSPLGTAGRLAEKAADAASAVKDEARGLSDDTRSAAFGGDQGDLADEATEPGDLTDAVSDQGAVTTDWAEGESVVVDHVSGPDQPAEFQSQDTAEITSARDQVTAAVSERDATEGTPEQQLAELLPPDALPLEEAEIDRRAAPHRLALAEDVDSPQDIGHLPLRGEGYYEVVIHGGPDGTFEARIEGADGGIRSVEMSPEQLAQVIESRPEWADRPILLTSCWAAESGAEIAERLGVAVYAPTSLLDVSFEGYAQGGRDVWTKVTVTPAAGGRWARFEPSWARER